MFGYVKAHKRELKIREYDTYCAAYCGLCRAMKKTTGQISRFVLNYDFVFLAVVRSVLTREKISVSNHRCIAHPLKKRPMLDLTPSLAYSAKATAGLTYYKAKDDLTDSTRAKKLLYALSFPFFKYLKRKTALPELETVIIDKLAALGKLEEERMASLDAPASLFGELLGHTFAYGLEGAERTLAYEIGYHTGKFVYAADAADDYEDDLRHGTYNPLVMMYPEGFAEENRQSVRTALLCELSLLEQAVDLVNFSGYADIEGIVRNIIYLGMPEQMERALFHNSDTESGPRKEQMTK